MDNASLREDLCSEQCCFGALEISALLLSRLPALARQSGVRCLASEILRTPLAPLAILRQPNEPTATTITLLRVFEDPRQRSPLIFDAEVVRVNGLYSRIYNIFLSK